MAWKLSFALTAALAATGCSALLRTKGGPPVETRPLLKTVQPVESPYRVWVLVPRLRVNTYPVRAKTQQPLLQFTGDSARYKKGTGRLALLAAPDRYKDGELVSYFDDKILWSDRLRADDPRTFTLWLRENNRSARTRLDRQLDTLGSAAGAADAIAGVAGVKLSARQAVAITAAVLRALRRDWLILEWSCPWRHILTTAQRQLQTSGQRSVVLETQLTAKERVKGKPVAELTVMFVVQRLHATLPAAVGKEG